MKSSSLPLFYIPKSKLKGRIKQKQSLSVRIAKITATSRHTADIRHAAYAVAMTITHLLAKKPGMNLHAVHSVKGTTRRTTKAAQNIKIYSTVRNLTQIITNLFLITNTLVLRLILYKIVIHQTTLLLPTPQMLPKYMKMQLLINPHTLTPFYQHKILHHIQKQI